MTDKLTHAHQYGGQTLRHAHGVSEVRPDLRAEHGDAIGWAVHGYFGHAQDKSSEDIGAREAHRPDHTHECRDCGADIPCDGDGQTCWDGGNAGCFC